MLKLGDINLDVPFYQAPLSGYSDYPMRKLAYSFGAPLTFAGVMLAKSAANPKVLKKPAFRPQDREHPIGAQILGNDPKVMALAAKELVNVGYDLIDLNFAYPAPKVIRRHRGGFLLKQPQRAIDIYRSVRDAVNCPVIVKLRIGFDNKPHSRENFWQIVSDLAADGADALTIHGRTVRQRFKDQADWNILTEIKSQFPNTIIIGSGDLFNAETTAEKLRTSNLDGVVLARGAIGNPWIFSQLKTLLKGHPIPCGPSLNEQAQTILTHFNWVSNWYETTKAIRFFRKFLVRYCKLHPDRKKVQHHLLAAQDHNQLHAAITKWYQIN